MSGPPKLVVNGRAVHLVSGFDMRQSYDWIGGVARRRMMSGLLAETRHWRKLATTISAGGWLPEGLSGMQGSISLDCIAPLSLSSASNVIAISRPARPDAAAFGHAMVGGVAVPTAVSLAGLTATLTIVAGATAYLVGWYPRLTVMADEPKTNLDAAGAVYGWELSLEEI